MDTNNFMIFVYVYFIENIDLLTGMLNQIHESQKYRVARQHSKYISICKNWISHVFMKFI